MMIVVAFVYLYTLPGVKPILDLSESGGRGDRKIAPSPLEDQYVENVMSWRKVSKASLELKQRTVRHYSFDLGFGGRVKDCKFLSNKPITPRAKIIHQVAESKILSPPWDSLQETWIEKNPTWDYMIWTDDTMRQLIKDDFPWFLGNYDSYTYPIQRADAIRYFILWKYGGVYVDT